MIKEIKEINNEILRITQSVVVHTPKYSKFGGYDGENDIYTMDIAKHLYKENYRKQIKAEWKYGKENGQYGYYCTNCKAGFVGENAEWIAKEHDYCPKCGALMKGGAK